MSGSTESKKQPRRRFIGRRSGNSNNDKLTTVAENGNEIIHKQKSRIALGRSVNHVPEDILNDKELNEAIKLLPSNYNFEIHKTVWNIRKYNAKRIALQMPEGLLIYSLIISDILEQFCGVETLVMGMCLMVHAVLMILLLGHWIAILLCITLIRV